MVAVASLPNSAVLTSEELATPRGLRQAILRLAWPVLAEMALMTAAQIIDLAMVSRLGAVAIASVGLSMQPVFLGMATMMGLAVGTTAIVARCIGSGDRDAASDVARQSLLAAMGLMLVMVIPAAVWADRLVLMMGAEPEVVALGSQYLRAMLPGLAFAVARFSMAGSLRGAGDTGTPMRTGILVNVLNVAGNWVLIFGHLGFPALGVLGAGIATSLARLVGVLYLFLHMLRSDSALSIRLSGFWSLRWDTLSRVARVGVPAALERAAMSVAQLGYIRIVSSLGTLDYAAHSVAINAESVSYMPAFAFAQAATTLVGQNLGARQPDAASRAGFACFRYGAVIGGLGTIVLLVIPHWLMRIYTADPELIARGVMCLRIMALAQIALVAGMTFPGALRGAGDTRSVLWVTVAGAFGVRLSLSLLFVYGFGWGLAGAWYAMGADWLVRAVLTYWRFKRGKWQTLDV